MEKKDICEMEIAFSAVEQSGEVVQAFTEEYLKALDMPIDPEKLQKAQEVINNKLTIDNRIREHVAKSLNASDYVTAVEMVGTHQHEAMVADAIRRGRQAVRYPLPIDDIEDDGFFKPLNTRRVNPGLSLIGGDFEGEMAIPVYQTESTAFHIYCYLLAKEQLRAGVTNKSNLKSLVHLCANFRRALNKSKLLRFLYKSYIKELKSKSNEEVKNLYIGIRNLFVDDVISKHLKVKPYIAYAFNAMDNHFSQQKESRPVPDLRLGGQFGHFDNWKEVNNVK